MPSANHPTPERDETEAQRIDRNWAELLQELRVAQTGVQILSGFLLILPFQTTFDRLDADQHAWYLGVIVAAIAATILILGPVVAHRILFRKHEKDVLLRASHVIALLGLALLGLALLGLTLAGVVAFVVDVVAGRGAAAVALSAAVALIVGVWIVVPLSIRRGHGPGRPYRSEL